ncbi:DUF1016 family protein [Fusobacterium ulcerans]|nr:DUF1016 family protein [Fusobacterium ulcerans]
MIEKLEDIFKDPYILEFLGLEERNYYFETELETGVINNLEKFIMELEKGFLFQEK